MPSKPCAPGSRSSPALNLHTGFDSPLQVRVGIATGVTVVGDLIGEGISREQTVVGDTPNLAARLQTLAEPGTVVISASTRRLTGGHFEYRDLGAVALKGWAEPIAAWQVLRTGEPLRGPARDRPDCARRARRRI
jgi:class 3 adenylate cyclase